MGRSTSWGRVAVIALAVALSGCDVTHRVYKVDSPAPLKGDGVYYWLPETVVVLEVRSQSVIKSVPVLASQTGYELAMKELFGIVKPEDLKEIRAKSNRTTVRDVAIKTQARRDLTQAFYIDVRGGAMEKRDLEVALTESGIITDGSSKAENRTAENVVAVVKVAAQIAGAVVGVAGDSPAVEVLTTSGASPLVQRAAQELIDLRARRILLMSHAANGPLTKDAFERMLAALDAEIAKAEAPFLGNLESRETTNTFRVLPSRTERGVQAFKLATYSPQSADALVRVAPMEAVLGVPLPAHLGTPGEVWAVLTPESLPPAVGFGSAGDSDTSGFYYRIPAVAWVSVYDGARPVRAEQVHIAQLGALARLPGRFNGKLASLGLSFHPETGAIKTISASSEPTDLSKLSGLADATTTLSKAVADRAAATSEQAQIKAENERLKLEVENIELQRRLESLRAATAGS